MKKLLLILAVLGAVGLANCKVDPSASDSGGLGKIYFFSERDGNDEIYCMNADGTNQVRLTTGTAGNAYPSWSRSAH
jgi:TolB protein